MGKLLKLSAKLSRIGQKFDKITREREQTKKFHRSKEKGKQNREFKNTHQTSRVKINSNKKYGFWRQQLGW